MVTESRAGAPGRALKRATVSAAALALVVMSASAAQAGTSHARVGHSGSAVPSGVISTIAGGPGGPAPATTVSLGTNLDGPCGVTAGTGGVYVADDLVVRKVGAGRDWLTTPVGNRADYPWLGQDPVGDGGLATKASLGRVCGVALDRFHNLVVADCDDNRVRVVAARTGTFYGQAMKGGDIYSVAGDGTAGFSGDGGAATSAELYKPMGVAVDAAGNLVIADYLNSRVRVVAARTGTFYGQAMTAGDIYTIAGGGSGGLGDGGPATSAEVWPYRVVVDGSGNLVIDESDDNRVRVVAKRTGTFYGVAMTAGDIYTVAGNGVMGFSGDGGPAVDAELDYPLGASVDGQGNILVADTQARQIQVVAGHTGTFYGQSMTEGDIYTIAGGGTSGLGDGGPALSAELNMPMGAAVDSSGNLVIADTYDGRVRVVAARTGTFYGMPMAAGDIYTVAGNGVTHFSGDGGLAGAAQIWQPEAVATDPAIKLAVVDTDNNRVRVVAAKTGTSFGQVMTAGHIYTLAGNGTAGFSGDGGPASQAELNFSSHFGLTDPWATYGVTFDHFGNLLISDTWNHQVRVVAEKTGTFYGQPMTAGDIYTVAQLAGVSSGIYILYLPMGLTVDRAGNIVIADPEGCGAYYCGAVMVLAVHTGTYYGQSMTAGQVYPIAGAPDGSLGDGVPATQAALVWPEDVTVDHEGNIVITDADSYRVCVIAEKTGTFYGQAMTTGDIYTVAGNGTKGFSGDGGPATQAELSQPDAVAVDHVGNLVIADAANNRVRVVADRAGTFYGLRMTAGDIYTVAGNGTGGYSGDGGPGMAAELSDPLSVAVNPAGDILIADAYSNRVRLVTP